MGPQGTPAPLQPVTGVDYIIAVGSGKGGVGKTTVSVNLALALAQLEFKVGLLDADVYGPNVPTMLGVNEPVQGAGDLLLPIDKHGLKVMSMGFLSPGDKPLIWRGPMLHSVIQQFLRRVAWGDLDFLIIDLPPGTGDVQLSLLQTTPLTGGIVVTTPSEVSLEDARKAVGMFQQLKAEVLGIVENMSGSVFGSGGGKRTAEKMGVPFLGELGLEAEVRIGGDSGRPVTLFGESNTAAAPFFALARLVAERAEGLGGPKGPTVVVSD
jgi:ATP-binding protein involved in chromosome partitioning